MMTNKICHLCMTHYQDDPFFTEKPGHSAEQCLKILNWRVTKQERELFDTRTALERAKRQYLKAEGK